MANVYVIGGPGDASGANAANGGGWTVGYDATYANTMGANGAPIISLSSCTVTQGGIGQIRIGYLGGFADAEIGQLVNIDFADTYTDGRYMITGVDASGNYIEVTAAYSSNTTTTTVKVGGALDKLETVDGLLASGDTLLIPNGSAGQRTYTETNTCTIGSASSGEVIGIKGVQNDGTEIMTTRSAIGGGIANGPLTSSQFPKIAFNATKFLRIGTYTDILNLEVTGDIDGATNGLIDSGTNERIHVVNCSFSNAGTGNALQLHTYAILYNVDAVCTAADHTQYVILLSSNAIIVNCRIGVTGDSNNTSGLLYISYGSFVVNNVFYGLAAGKAVSTVYYGSAIIGNVFYDITGDCIETSNAAISSNVLIANNVSYSCTTFIDNGYTVPQRVIACDNAFRTVTTEWTDADWFGLCSTSAALRGDIALLDDPFVNSGEGDFNISNTADTRAKLIGKSSFGTDLGALGHDPDYPTLANVMGDTVNGVPGTLAEDDVLTTAGGDYVSPATSIVKDGEFYGPDSSYEGEYAGGGGGGGLLQGNKRGNKQ